MNRNFIRAGALIATVSALMAGIAFADDNGYGYGQTTPNTPATNLPPPPAQSDMQQGSDSMTMPQGSDMSQPGMDNSDMSGQPQDGMSSPPPGGVRNQPPGMSGGRSNAPMPPPPANGGTMAPPPGNNMPSSSPGPQSKRAPIKSKAQVSKKQ